MTSYFQGLALVLNLLLTLLKLLFSVLKRRLLPLLLLPDLLQLVRRRHFVGLLDEQGLLPDQQAGHVLVQFVEIKGILRSDLLLIDLDSEFSIFADLHVVLYVTDHLFKSDFILSRHHFLIRFLARNRHILGTFVYFAHKQVQFIVLIYLGFLKGLLRLIKIDGSG